MQLPDGAGVVVGARPAMLADGAFGWFNPMPVGVAGTVVTPDWLNGVTAELLSIITAGTPAAVLSKNDVGQVLAAIQALIAAANNVPTGTRVGRTARTAPAGWILGNGLTIGNAASNATNRPNADTQALFTLLYNDYADSELPLKTSGGGATTRGAQGTAAAAYAANCQITVPDYCGRLGVGRDDMKGAPANRVTAAGCGVDGTIIGASGGEQTHQLTVPELPAHHHTGAMTNVTGGSSVSSSGASPVNTGDTGGDQPHQNMPPFIIETVIIKL